MPSFTFFKAVQWVRLESLPGRVWPLGLIFDILDVRFGQYKGRMGSSSQS